MSAAGDASVPSISVVVATRDRVERLARLLDCLERQTLVPEQVVVVDDGSTDGTATLLEERAGLPGSRIVPVRLARPGGPAAARNAGALKTSSEVLAFTDDDCQPNADWLEHLARRVSEGADVVVGRTVADPAEWARRGTWSHVMTTDGSDLTYSTCNIAYRTKVFRALGGFDPGFRASRGGAQWGEDTDLGWRAVESGASAQFAEESLVQHDVVPRGWAGYCLAGLRRQGVPRLVRKHPGYRKQLWGGVFLNRAHALAPLGALGLAVAGATAAAAPGVSGLVVVVCFLPYVHFRVRVWPLPGRRRALPYVLPLLWVADLAETIAVVVAAGRNRALVV